MTPVNRVLCLYHELYREYGDPRRYWPQWCAHNKTISEREKIIIGMILVQRTSWHNANLALKGLKSAGLLSVDTIAKIKSPESLAPFIRPAGFYQSKPRRLCDVCTYIVNQGGVAKLMTQDIDKLRTQLLAIKGVGKETADTILLYALDKPVFIIDEYTRRFCKVHQLGTETDYDKLQQLFMCSLAPGSQLYQNMHALIIISQRGREKSVMERV